MYGEEWALGSLAYFQLKISYNPRYAPAEYQKPERIAHRSEHKGVVFY